MSQTGREGARGGSPGQETAGTMAVIADQTGFALMRRYPTFRFADHAAYLRHTEAVLRSLAERHAYTSVALFDPVGFADWCEQEGLDPDSAASRSRYAGEIAVHGATVPYQGQPIRRLVHQLLAEHERWTAWELGTDLLAEAGSCPVCGDPMPHCAFQRAAATLGAILERAEPGTHHLVCSLVAESGPLTAALHVDLGAGGAVRLAEPDALVLCTVLAAGLATGGSAGLVLRSVARGPAGQAPGPEEVRGWSLHGGLLRALDEAEVRAAYRTDARTGEPLPPEPGVSYRDAPRIAPVRCGS
jgi:hypothetical protein